MQQTTTRGTLTLSSPTTVDLRVESADWQTASAIEGRQFIRAGSLWRFPLRSNVVDRLVRSFPLDVDPAIIGALGRVESRDQRVRELKDAGWEQATPVAPMPIKAKPYQHQVLAFNLCAELLG